jgi:hypothetical protein
MGQTYPRGAKFEQPLAFGAVPAGLYHVVLPLFEEGRTNDGAKLKYDSGLGMRIVGVKKILDAKHVADPASLVGMSIYAHNDFVIGPVDGASGELLDPDDWLKNGAGRGGPRFNNMIEAAGIEPGDDVDEICAALEGREVIVHASVEAGTDNGTGGKYPDKNRIVKFYPLSDEARPAARTTATAAAPSRPAAALARPATPAPSASRQVAAGARPAATATAPARPARAAAPKADLILCDICEADGVAPEEAKFSRADFPTHIREMHP